MLVVSGRVAWRGKGCVSGAARTAASAPSLVPRVADGTRGLRAAYCVLRAGGRQGVCGGGGPMAGRSRMKSFHLARFLMIASPMVALNMRRLTMRRTRVLLVACTVAERGLPVSRDSSPQLLPAERVRTCFVSPDASVSITSAVPSLIT